MNILRKVKNIFETNRELAFFFDKIAATSLYRIFIYHKIKKYAERIKKDKRYNVIIETTNLCNARCAMCPHSKMQRKAEVMKDATFLLIVEKLKKEKINPLAFILNGFGDPLTDLMIFERVKKLKKEFPHSAIKFYSNFGMANENIIEKILNSGLDELNVSFNGYDKKSYEQTMNIDYQKTLDNLEKLIGEKNKSQSRLKIRMSMTLVSENDGGEKSFIEEWQDKVDSVSVNKIHTYGSAVADSSGKNKINFKKLAYPCKYLWNTIVLGAAGDMFLCCLDYDGQYNFGNIENNDILDIFYGEKFTQMREKHLQNKIKDIRMCSQCYTPYRNGVEWLVDNLY